MFNLACLPQRDKAGLAGLIKPGYPDHVVRRSQNAVRSRAPARHHLVRQGELEGVAPSVLQLGAPSVARNQATYSFSSRSSFGKSAAMGQ
jgi:hypothetical protein